MCMYNVSMYAHRLYEVGVKKPLCRPLAKCLFGTAAKAHTATQRPGNGWAWPPSYPNRLPPLLGTSQMHARTLILEPQGSGSPQKADQKS